MREETVDSVVEIVMQKVQGESGQQAQMGRAAEDDASATQTPGSDHTVDLGWIDESEYRAAKEAVGYSLSWSREEKVQTRLVQGYEIAHHIDEDGIRHRIRAGDLILLLKKEQ